MSQKNAKISIIMGSDSDLDVMDDAMKTLDQFKVAYEVKIVSAHRTPKYMQSYSLAAEKRGIKVIIAGAGGAAHLPGMVASYTTIPVIGVPVAKGKLKGLDALLSIAQMPGGVPVATMAIENSKNAALMALRILGISSSGISKKLKEFNKAQKIKVSKANTRVSKLYS